MHIDTAACLLFMPFPAIATLPVCNHSVHRSPCNGRVVFMKKSFTRVITCSRFQKKQPTEAMEWEGIHMDRRGHKETRTVQERHSLKKALESSQYFVISAHTLDYSKSNATPKHVLTSII